MTAAWHFRTQQPGEDVHNPLGGEHFNQGISSDSDWEAGESLVRESIQNSLDAGRPDEAVHVRFHVSAPKAMSVQVAQHWFGELWPHLRAKQCQLRSDPAPAAGGFLVIEDFGTRGLKGDYTQWNMPRDSEENDFFNFFRAEGLSGKGAGRGGSWGVGKSVFGRCSRINCFLAATLRHDDGEAFVLGKTLLRHHYIGNTEFRAIGHFGISDQNHESLILPSRDESVRARLQRDFALQRAIGADTDRESAGLSVVIPYADLALTAVSLLSTVVREYFEPILRGQLTVGISGPGLPRGVASVRLNAENILEHARSICKPEVVRLLRLAEWAEANKHANMIELRGSTAEVAPRWEDSLFPSETPEFRAVCERYVRGDPVGIRVPLRVCPGG